MADARNGDLTHRVTKMLQKGELDTEQVAQRTGRTCLQAGSFLTWLRKQGHIHVRKEGRRNLWRAAA